MTRYLLTRLGAVVPVLVAASIGIFALIRLVPGDPASTMAGPGASPEAVDAIRRSLGLDQPFWSQYVHWLGHLVTFHLGRSYQLGGTVSGLVGAAALNTVVLTLAALVLAGIGALLASTVAVVADRMWLNNLLAMLNTAALAVPTFAMAFLLVLTFAVRIPILPAGGTPPEGMMADPGITVQYLALPALALALPVWAVLTRYLTEGLRTQMRQPYVTTARALGISRRRIVLTQALRTALPPTITMLGMQLGALLGGALLVENVFAWPGLGRLMGNAISNHDYPVVQVLLVLSVLVFVLAQVATDLIHAWLDPRIRLNGGH